MANDINVRVGMSGESSFRQSLKNIDTELRTVGTEVKKVSSEFIGSENSIDALTAKNEVLNRQYEAQKSKVELLGKQLDEVKQKYGEGSDQVQRLQQKLNLAETAMNKTDAEIKKNTKSMEELGEETHDTGEALEDATDSGSRFGDVLKANLAGDAIKAGIHAIGSAVKSLVSAFVDVTKSAVEAYSEFEQLAGGVDVLFGEAGDAVKKNAQEAFKTAGLSANEYMETVTSFSASLIASLGGDTVAAAKYADTAIRDMADNANKMGSDISSLQSAYAGFAKGQYQLLDNLKLGYGGTKTEMERLLKEAEELPSAMGRKFDISNYADVVEAIHLIQEEMGIYGATAQEAATTIEGSINSTKAAWQNLLVALADGSQDMDSIIKSLVESASNVIKNVLPVVKSVLKNIPAAIREIAPDLLKAATDIVRDLLPSVLQAAVELLPAVGEVALEAINVASTTLLDNLPMIINAAVQLVGSLVTGIGEALPMLIPAAIDCIMQIVESLTEPDSTLMLIDAAIAIVIGLTEGIVDAIPKLVERMPAIIINIVSALIQAVPRLLAVGPKMMESLATGMVNNTAAVIRAVKDLWNRIVEAFSSLVSGAKEWGKDMIENFVAGIKGMIDKVKNAVKNVASAVKDFLGFSEPKKGPLSNFHTYAPDMMKLFAQGIRDNEYRVTDQLASSFSGLKFPVEAQYGTMGSALQNIASGMVGDFVSNITLEIDGTTLARKQYRYNLAEVARNGGALA